MRVFFYFDGLAGRGLLGRRARRFEKQGFDRCPLVRRVRTAASADAIYVRNIPERTTDKNLARMDRFLADHPDTPILNHPRSTLLHDSKDRTLAAWSDAGLKTPDWIDCEDPERLESFVAEHPQVLLRLNNSACGKNTVVLRQPGTDGLLNHHRVLVDKARLERVRCRADTRPLAVALIDSRDRHGLFRLYRAFVVAGVVHGGYALVSSQPLVSFASSTCATEAELASFLEANSQLDAWLGDPHCVQTMVDAAAALDLQITCIDFLCVDDQLILLEANPLWSPSFVWAGGRQGRRRFRKDPVLWQARARSYCAWMDRVGFYEGMYGLFDRF